MKTLKIILLVFVASIIGACGGGGSDPVKPPVASAKTGFNPMSYGFTISDSGGRLVATDAFPAMHFVGKAAFSSTVQSMSPGGAIVRYTVSAPTSAPLPFLYVPAGSYASVNSVTLLSGTTYAVDVLTNAAPASVQVYCFARLGTASSASATHGVQILDANGNLNFSSASLPLLIDAVASFAFTSDNSAYSYGAIIDSASAPITAMVKPAISGGAIASGGDLDLFAEPGTTAVFRGSLMLSAGAGAIYRVKGPIANEGVGTGNWVNFAQPETVFVIDASRYD